MSTSPLKDVCVWMLVCVCVCVYVCVCGCSSAGLGRRKQPEPCCRAPCRQEGRGLRGPCPPSPFITCEIHGHSRVLTPSVCFPTCSCWIQTHIYTQNGVMEAERAESGFDSLASPAAAEMNGRAENCLHS